MDLSCGSLVRLRSGGPKMTVCSWDWVGEDVVVKCCWMASDAVQVASFPIATLESAQPQQCCSVPPKAAKKK